MVSWNDADDRLVQTAVLNRPESEEPVIFPTEKAAAQRFRRQYAGRTFWCGSLLGGCGGQLSDKIYGDRVCHFAHHASSNECTRQGAIDSADHLYATREIKSWLGPTGLGERTARYHGDLSSGAECRRVVLDGPGPFPAICVEFSRELDDYLRRMLRTGDIHLADWLIKDNRSLALELIEHNGYALHIQFKNDGLHRTFDIGTQTGDLRTRWNDLSECTFTRAGIRTPVLEERRLVRITAEKPLKAPSQGFISAHRDKPREDEVVRLRRRLMEALKRRNPRVAEEVIEAISWKWSDLSPEARSEFSTNLGPLQKIVDAQSALLGAQRLLQDWRTARKTGQSAWEKALARRLRRLAGPSSTRLDAKHKAEIRAELERVESSRFSKPRSHAKFGPEQVDDIICRLNEAVGDGAIGEIRRLRSEARPFSSDERISTEQRKRVARALKRAKAVLQAPPGDPSQ